MEENERRFEQDIERYLLSEDGGYVKGYLLLHLLLFLN